jgi:hypothetical protein
MLPLQRYPESDIPLWATWTNPPTSNAEVEADPDEAEDEPDETEEPGDA